MKSCLEKIDLKQCVLCGSVEDLTGEHKVKASILKLEHGNKAAYFFGKDDYYQPKIAQSPKSKEFHFDYKICKNCNSARTQNADKAFHDLHVYMRSPEVDDKFKSDSPNCPNLFFSNTDWLNVCRYFAKIMCCYIADSGGPRLNRVASFAMGTSNTNPINLDISAGDPSIGIATGFVALVFDQYKTLVTKIEVTQNIKSVKYHFFIELDFFESLELKELCPEIILSALSDIEKHGN